MNTLLSAISYFQKSPSDRSTLTPALLILRF